MRELLVSDLVRDILGPRNGAHETIHGSPLSEYITGILSPRCYAPERRGAPEKEKAPEGEEEEGITSPLEDVPSEIIPPEYEDEFEDRDVFPLFRHPALDPQKLPHSMGLRFALAEDGGKAEIQLCVTWARYKKGPIGVFQRIPRAWVSRSIPAGLEMEKVFYLNEDGECSGDSAEVSVRVRWRRDDGGFWHVSVYLVNEICGKDSIKLCEKEGGKDSVKSPIECHVFQPQIRVKVLRGRRVPMGRVPVGCTPEEEELEFVYRRRLGMARGHMCSAVWGEIDPEKPAGDPEIEKLRPPYPPFYWVDGEIVERKYGREVRESFTAPDFRTEFVPVYLVEAPELEWPAGFEPAPELGADVLAEAWEKDELRRCVEPLLNGYREWIEGLKRELQTTGFSEKEKEISGRILKKCQETLERMEKGFRLLLEDEDARLAFCFANKVMDVQARWAGRSGGLRWYPYQLAFILTVLESLASPESGDRMVCDLLWVPTGAGKTEACLALAAFIMAYRRRRALQGKSGNRTGAGVAVISRYTLRLLTIQQFRRALRMVAACEYLRVYGLYEKLLGQKADIPVGWRPRKCPMREDFIWGSVRFSIGLWVGGNVTPNRLSDIFLENKCIPGALSILRGKGRGRWGEPAQIITCPACGTLLAVPETGLEGGREHTIYLLLRSASDAGRIESALNDYAPQHPLSEIRVLRTGAGRPVLRLTLRSQGTLGSEDVDELWEKIRTFLKDRKLDVNIWPVRASRPGYFSVGYPGPRGGKIENFEIFCPNPGCPLGSKVCWTEGVPVETGIVDESRKRERSYKAVQGAQMDRLGFGKVEIRFPDGMFFRSVPEFCRITIPGAPHGRSGMYISEKIPVPALTVDEQIYRAPPSLLVATADKFARLPFEPRSAAIFGNVDHYHPHLGYFREHCDSPPRDRDLSVPVRPFDPPDLIIQDELHLIEGPLGSLVGLYETAVDFLCGKRAKYIALTATIRGGSEHVRTLYVRNLAVFPPPGLDADNRFFIRGREAHQLDRRRAGRLYVGVCAPGRGPHTPQVRIWARLLQSVYDYRKRAGSEADPYWTLVGYFNSIRELSGARALYRQDIRERLRDLSGSPRPISDETCRELSSRTPSTSLPGILQELEGGYGTFIDTLFTTSMFGTGVDVPRLSLMTVCGQPKTTAAYIQATGRIGRMHPGLVVTFYRATRPRDLSHYEFFCGYHRAMERYVENLTAYPFSPGTLQRGAGAVIVAILRNMRGASVNWESEDSAMSMARYRRGAGEIEILPDLFFERGNAQPEGRRPVQDLREFINHLLDLWEGVALNISGLKEKEKLKYAEYRDTRCHVVLGDPAHRHAGKICIYRDVSQSLRDVEETIGLQTRSGRFPAGGGSIRRSI